MIVPLHSLTGGPHVSRGAALWIPAFAGMTGRDPSDDERS